MSGVKKIVLALVIVLGFILIISVSSAGGATLSPSLEQLLDHAAKLKSDTTIKVVIFASDAHSRQIQKAAARTSSTLSDRHSRVINDLKAYKSSALDQIKRSIINSYPKASFREFWLVPAISTEIPLSTLASLLSHPDIEAVYEDAALDYLAPVESFPALAAKTAAVRSHLDAMNIPAVWSRGIDGSGRLVCNFDTGVDGDHPALQYNWRGLHASLSSTWFAPYITGAIPNDKVGHGTQTMGIMIGSIPSDSFGVAPGAEWIAAAVVDQGQTLQKTFSDIIAAFQWAVDPDGNPATHDDVPDVILNSWGVPTSVMPPCDATFNQVIDNVEAAGVVTIFAAGNEGPNPYTLRLPANRAAGPYNTFAVGAIDHTTDIIANFSSRGPSSCDSVSVKPEVVAPGVGIYTSYKDGTYRFTSGTSMSAPIIAGLVALMRQYNPDATVEEIKYALIKSCRDMGPAGEDNTYGNGLPDALTALSFLPVPATPEVWIVRKIIGGDGLADPGETFDLFLRLDLSAPGFDSLTGYISCNDPRVGIVSDKASFIFGAGAITTVNIRPYVLTFGESILNGELIEFELNVNLPHDIPYDVLPFTLVVGTSPAGNMFTHSTGMIDMTISDFGQYGLAENSVYSAGGVGFRFNNSENLLYEAGIMIGRSSLQISTAVRDSLGRAGSSDFTPSIALETQYPSRDGALESQALYVDTESPIPIPITVRQAVISYDTPEDNQYVIFRYFLINQDNAPISGLYFGFLSDFDIDAEGDQAGYIEDMKLYYQSGASGLTGIMPLSASCGLSLPENNSGKLAFTNAQKYGYISRTGIDSIAAQPSDKMSVLNFGPYYIAPYDSVEIALILVAGESLENLTWFAIRAAEKYFGYTDLVTDEDPVLPNQFELAQNYPNPFNPTTTIGFTLPAASLARLEIYNILGQKVTTLFEGMASPGKTEILWDGTDGSGRSVASGIYFYKLSASGTAQSKKMLLLK